MKMWQLSDINVQKQAQNVDKSFQQTFNKLPETFVIFFQRGEISPNLVTLCDTNNQLNLPMTEFETGSTIQIVNFVDNCNS